MMKKIFNSAVILLTATILACFTSCAPEVPVNYIGSKKPSEAKQVGDIIFKDGSATPYAEMTAEQKADAIAVIYYVGTDADLLGKKTLGISVDFGNLIIASADSEYTKYFIESTYCRRDTDKTTEVAWVGDNPDKYGADNLQQIADWLDAVSEGNKNDTGIPASNGNPSIKTKEQAESLYPAFYKLKDMNSFLTANISGTKFEKGWYIPTYAELIPLENNSIDYKAILRDFSSKGTTPSYFFTSSQYEAGKSSVVIYVLGNTGVNTYGSGSSNESSMYNTIYIREF